MRDSPSCIGKEEMASFLWTGIALFLYLEMAVAMLLCLPILKPVTWQRIFNSRFMVAIRPGAKTSFFVVCLLLVIFFAESIRSMRHYSIPAPVARSSQLDAELHRTKNMFRSQRNFYITGFALFLMVVIWRLVKMTHQLAVHEESKAKEQKTD